MTTTFVTHGRKYHLDPACPRMIHGEELHDCEGDPDWANRGYDTHIGCDPTTGSHPNTAA